MISRLPKRIPTCSTLFPGVSCHMRLWMIGAGVFAIEGLVAFLAPKKERAASIKKRDCKTGEGYQNTSLASPAKKQKSSCVIRERGTKIKGQRYQTSPNKNTRTRGQKSPSKQNHQNIQNLKMLGFAFQKSRKHHPY